MTKRLFICYVNVVLVSPCGRFVAVLVCGRFGLWSLCRSVSEAVLDVRRDSNGQITAGVERCCACYHRHSEKSDRGLGQILHDQLHWLDIPDRVLFKLAVTVRQCRNGRAPPYLSEHCIPVSSTDTRRHLRSSNRHLLAVPRFRLNTYGRRAFLVAGPMALNSLPDFIRDPTSSTDCFRRLLKTYLFARHWCIQRIRASQRLCAVQIHALIHSLTVFNVRCSLPKLVDRPPAWVGLSVTSVMSHDCLSVCPCCKTKIARAINTKTTGALGVLNDCALYKIYKSTHALTHSLRRNTAPT